MNHHYRDIRDRVAAPPAWFDERAVPRYCEFSPDEAANIYADECCLAEIRCQDCGHKFKVAFSSSVTDIVRRWMVLHDKEERITQADAAGMFLAADIKARRLHYGDPPNSGCCMAGPTMNSTMCRVLEFWHRPNFDWERDAALEVEFNL